MESQIVINNLLINFIHFDPAKADRDLVFLHGWRSESKVWADIAYRFQDNGLRIYALDLPGFGRSREPKGPFGVGDYAAVAAGFINKLELKSVILVGHSFGGRVAIKLAANYPQIISKLVLVDSAGFAAHQTKKNLMAIIAKLAKPFFKPKFMQPLRKKIYQQIGAEDYVATPQLQKTFIKVVKEDLSVDMKKIYQPTLIVWGENDQETPLTFGQKMHQMIGNSKLQVLKNAGHFSFLDQPDEFGRVLEHFVDS